MEEGVDGHIHSYNTYHANSKKRLWEGIQLIQCKSLKTIPQTVKKRNRKASKDARKPNATSTWELSMNWNSRDTSDKTLRSHYRWRSPFYIMDEVFWWPHRNTWWSRHSMIILLPVSHMSSQREDEQALRPKSILLTTSRQQKVGQNSDRAKSKAFSPNKSAKHRGKSHSKAWIDLDTEYLLILAISISQEPSHPIMILHAHEWFAGMTPWAGSRIVSWDFH